MPSARPPLAVPVMSNTTQWTQPLASGSSTMRAKRPGVGRGALPGQVGRHVFVVTREAGRDLATFLEGGRRKAERGLGHGGLRSND